MKHERLLKYAIEPAAPKLEPLVVSYKTAGILLDKRRTAIVSAVSRGNMPKPIKIGKNNYFRKHEFDAWLVEKGIIRQGEESICV